MSLLALLDPFADDTDFPTLPYTSASETPTLLYTSGLKKSMVAQNLVLAMHIVEKKIRSGWC